MRLLSIKLDNFQAHADLEVELSPTITTIIGPTDRGKSAVLRALGWVLLNNLPGDEFVREGAAGCEVQLVFEDEGKFRTRTVARSRRGRSNRYLLDNKEYLAFGAGVPAGIARRVRVSELNFQGQHTAPFWFSESAPEVARQLNAVVDLSIIDEVMSRLASWVRTAQERLTVLEEQAAQARDELKGLQASRKRVTHFQQIIESDAEFKRKKNRCGDLAALLRQVRSNPSAQLARQARDGDRVLAAGTDALVSRRRAGDLDRLLTELRRLQSCALSPPDFSGVARAYDARQRLGARARALRDLLRRRSEQHFAADALRAAAVNIEREFHKQLKGKLCPLCGNLIQ